MLLPRGVTTSAKAEELVSVLVLVSLGIEQCVSDRSCELCLPLSLPSGILPKIKHFSTREIKIFRDELGFLEMLKTTLDMAA